MPTFRNSASFGKRQEYVAISELLRRKFDVYLTLVDDQGIDCVVRGVSQTGPPRYIDLQIKARSKEAVPRDAAFFGGGPLARPRPNYWFLFYSERGDVSWVMPSLDLNEQAHVNKTGKHKGRWSIRLGRTNSAGAVLPRPKFRDYEGETGFELLNRALRDG